MSSSSLRTGPYALVLGASAGTINEVQKLVLPMSDLIADITLQRTATSQSTSNKDGRDREDTVRECRAGKRLEVASTSLLSIC